MRIPPALQRRSCLSAFALAALISAAVFLPFVVMDRGLFFYYGDFNVQQIPFYQLVHRAVRSGDVFWNWYTDLGVNFIGSYGFYNLFSPFFWLTLPFPTAALPYLMAPLLVLKTACAAAAGCLYIRRFVRDARCAVIGGLLYAFSGWATYNIFFNHFHEVLVFFPLLLYALELLVVEGRRGPFALAVAINAVVNYWFFIGTVVFTLLYVAVRTFSRGWAMTWRKFFAVALEAVAGVLLSCLALLPSVLAILGNPRTTADNLLSGWDFWLYGHEQRPPAILASLFFPPDIPSRPNLFPDHGAKWSSLSAWLPLFGPSLVIAYALSAKGWLKRMLYACLLIALVPGLNAAFILFNNSYYARWFYMPLLLMALASAIALERAAAADPAVDLRRGARITTAVAAAAVAAIGLTPKETEEGWTVGLMKYPERFWIYAAIAALCLGLLWYLIRRLRRPGFFRALTVSLGCVCAVYSVTMIAMGRMHSNDREWMRETVIGRAGELALPKAPGQFDRADIYDNMDNLGMYWGLPNIQAFHSIVPVSLMAFYPSVDVKRDVSSKPQPEYYALRSLLSVRWLFVAEDEPEDKQPSTPYFSYWGNQLGFYIYENDNYLPMGLAYTRYATRAQFEALPKEDRQKLLHRAVLVEDEDQRRASLILDPLPDTEARGFSEEAFLADVAERRRTAGDSFVIDNRGFTSELSLEADSIVFYSVPYDAGWRATVNGVETQVLKVNGGFCGVPVNAGESAVRFTYLAPGLRAGALLTLTGLLLLAGYLLLARRLPPLPRGRSYDLTPVDGAAADMPLPVADAPLPVADAPLPVADAPLPVADAPLPMADAPLPMADAEGGAFVWRGEEAPDEAGLPAQDDTPEGSGGMEGSDEPGDPGGKK